jgi:hypothetical protein
MTWLVLVISAVLLVLGVAWYGWSWEVHQRFVSDIFGRLHGPMTLRFFLQPTLGLVAAVHDGIRDVQGGHKSFFWTAWWDPKSEPGRLREGLNSTARMALIGFCMDIIYQFKVFDHFYPAEAVAMVLLLAVVPYFVFRWVVEHIARWWLARKSPS